MNIDILRHSLSHVLALAVKRIYGDRVKFGTGPATENGFFYDFEFPKPLTESDLSKIQTEMEEIVKENISFRKKAMPMEESKEFFKGEKQPYKLELLEGIGMDSGSPYPSTGQVPAGTTTNVTHYQLGEFEDLCKGPHIKNTGEVKIGSFQLERIAGAYWQADEKNKMLTRIYGLAFVDKKALKRYLALRTEAKKRDHRKLGKELDLFHFSDLVGPGLPLFTPKGTIIKEELQKEVEKICRGYGFEKVSTPHLAKIDLYELSGHKQKFGEELFHVKSHHKQNYVMKPVQCPHQTHT